MAMSDALDLERTATEVAVAAARFAAAERAVQAAKVRGDSPRGARIGHEGSNSLLGPCMRSRQSSPWGQQQD